MEGRFFLTALVIIFLTNVTIPAKAESITKKGDSTSLNVAELRKLYSFNKVIPQEFEKEILISLSHYPELSKTKIKFCYANIFTSMKAVPSLGFLFQKRENRTYRIVMNKKQCSGTNVMQRAGSDALIGVLGHELGHIVDYSQHKNLSLLKLLMSYIPKTGRMATEKRADQIAVEHQLGKQLLEFNNHILQDACMDPKYIKYKKKFYNSSSSISSLIEDNEKVTSF
jgi:hypothetical protein